VLADVVYCWGEVQREQLIAMKAPAEKLVVTGCPRLTRGLTPDPETARRKAGLDPVRPVALLATNPIRMSDRIKIAAGFCRAFAGSGEVSAVIRLHRSESTGDYAEVMRGHPGAVFLENRVWSLDESLAAASVVVIQDSNFGNDALMKGRPVVVFNPLEAELRGSRELVDGGGCPLASDAAELGSIVGRLLSDKEYRAGIQARGDSFVRRYFAAFGSEAAQRIAEDVVRRSGVRQVGGI
jgi:hypothetical protein